MSSPSDEYQTALETIKANVFGDALIQEVTAFSHLFCTALFANLEGKADPLSPLHSVMCGLLKNDGVKMALYLMGRGVVVDVVEKNGILLLGRLMAEARRMDTVKLEDKLSYVIKALTIFASQAQAWNAFLDESTRHIHDKKERRARRHALGQGGGHHPSADVLAHGWQNVVSRLLSILLPHGAASVYLPSGGSIFLPKLQEMLDSSLPSIGQWLEKYLFRRDLKIDLLYEMYSEIHQWVTRKQRSLPQKPLLANENECIVHLEPAISPLCHAFVPCVFSLGTEVRANLIASKVVEMLAGAVQTLSIESLLVSGIFRCAKAPSVSSPRHTERELDNLIEQMASDERIIRAIAQAVIPTPELEVPKNPNTVSVFFDLMVHGLKASAVEALLQGVLSSFNWQEAQQVALERLRWFALSPYCDQALLQVGGGDGGCCA